jgi:pimeloyl-ACP methyl ester carboxylesterase
MATFVLVHGAFLGGWCWRHVRRLLREAGHDVWTPTLTGAGERAHLLTPDIGLSLHIQDVVSMLELEELGEVILVGHSYGGMVITGVADRVPGRVAQLVYLDAHVPIPGQNSMGNLAGDTSDKLEALTGQGPRLLPPVDAVALGLTREEDRAWTVPKMVPHPLKALEEPIRLEHGEPRVPRTYILCTQRAELIAFFGADPLEHFIGKARRDGFRFIDIDSGHSPMISHPREVAEALVTLAR